jgi:hypothetical protein
LFPIRAMVAREATDLYPITCIGLFAGWTLLGPISDLRKIRTRDHHYAPPPHRADNRLQRDAPSLSPTPLLPLMGPIGEVAAQFVEVRSLGHGGLDLLRLSSSHFDPQTTSPSVDLTTSRPLVRNG